MMIDREIPILMKEVSIMSNKQIKGPIFWTWNDVNSEESFSFNGFSHACWNCQFCILRGHMIKCLNHDTFMLRR